MYHIVAKDTLALGKQDTRSDSYHVATKRLNTHWAICRIAMENPSIHLIFMIKGNRITVFSHRLATNICFAWQYV